MKEFKFSFSHGLSALSELPEPFKPALPTEELDTPFKKMYPPEALGEELTGDARVWKVYRNEATKADAVLLDGWNKTLDILLVFAGLFSAVVTSFVGQSNTQLQPDSNAYVANALFHLVKLNGSVDTLPAPPSLDAAPTSTVVWINALWFTSLLLSLAVAFLCILAKQWIGEYVARTTSTSIGFRDWSIRRAFYVRGLDAWGLPGFLSFLPVLLHISLFLFIAGLCLSMWAVSRTIALCLIPVGSCLAVFYIIATLVPFWRPDCPTALPLIDQLRAALLVVLRTSLATCICCFPAVRKGFQMLRRYILWPVYDTCIIILHILLNVLLCRNVSLDLHSSDKVTPFHLTFFDEERPVSVFDDSRVPRGLFVLRRTLLSLPKKALRVPHWRRHIAANDAEVLRWLILECSDNNVVAVGYQALGSVVHDCPLANHIKVDDAVQKAISAGRAWTYTHTPAKRSPTEIMRVLRSSLLIRPPVYSRNTFDYSWLQHLRYINYPDMALVSACRDLDHGRAREELEKATLPFSDLPPSPTIQSTLGLLFRIPGLPIRSFYQLLLCASEDTLTSHCAFIAGRVYDGDRSCQHLPSKCPAPLQCLSEAVCASLEIGTHCNGLRAELVLRLQLFSNRRRQEGVRRAPSLFITQQLLSCLVSETSDFTLSTVKHIAALIPGPVHWRFNNLDHCVTAIAALSTLCRQLASDVQQDNALAPELKAMIDHVLIYVVFLASNSHPDWSLEFVPPAQEMFGSSRVPPYADFVARAPWADIFDILPWASSRRLEIACFMIGALCSKDRNPIDRRDLDRLDHSLVHLLRDGQSTAKGRDMLCHFARHRIQLGGDGWASDVDALEAGGVAYVAGEITRDVLFLGPCEECAGHSGQHRWEPETEVYLIDLCQRLGVRFDGRYDADPDLQFLIELIALGAMVDAV